MKTRLLSLLFLFAFLTVGLVSVSNAPILKTVTQQTQATEESGLEKWDGSDVCLHSNDFDLVRPAQGLIQFPVQEIPTTPEVSKLRRPPKV